MSKTLISELDDRAAASHPEAQSGRCRCDALLGAGLLLAPTPSWLSLLAVAGDRNLTAYSAAASAALYALMAARSARGLSSTCLQWSCCTEAGMAARDSTDNSSNSSNTAAAAAAVATALSEAPIGGIELLQGTDGSRSVLRIMCYHNESLQQLAVAKYRTFSSNSTDKTAPTSSVVALKPLDLR